MTQLLLLRPEPGLSASLARIRALGLDAVPCPLFRVEAVDWSAPDPACFNGLLLTSANALRHGGPELGQLTSLPVHAVGAATASAARELGFTVASVGSADVAALCRQLPPGLRLLHLCGEDRRALPQDCTAEQVTVYRSMPIADPGLPPLAGLVAAVHSPRAAARLAELVGDRARTIIVAISEAAAGAAGTGWQQVSVAPEPSDASLLALAARLCHTAPGR